MNVLYPDEGNPDAKWRWTMFQLRMRFLTLLLACRRVQGSSRYPESRDLTNEPPESRDEHGQQHGGSSEGWTRQRRRTNLQRSRGPSWSVSIYFKKWNIRLFRYKKIKMRFFHSLVIFNKPKNRFGPFFCFRPMPTKFHDWISRFLFLLRVVMQQTTSTFYKDQWTLPKKIFLRSNLQIFEQKKPTFFNDDLEKFQFSTQYNNWIKVHVNFISFLIFIEIIVKKIPKRFMKKMETIMIRTNFVIKVIYLEN